VTAVARESAGAMPFLEMWLPPAAGEGGPAAGLFLDAAAHGALLAAMPGCSVSFGAQRRGEPPGFLSLSLTVKGGRGFVPASVGLLPGTEEKGGAGPEESEALVGATSMPVADVVTDGKVVVVPEKAKEAHAGAGAMNTTKHLWAGAVAAMVSRYSRLLLVPGAQEALLRKCTILTSKLFLNSLPCLSMLCTLCSNEMSILVSLYNSS
jgi:hypothetical protein